MLKKSLVINAGGAPALLNLVPAGYTSYIRGLVTAAHRDGAMLWQELLWPMGDRPLLSDLAASQPVTGNFPLAHRITLVSQDEALAHFTQNIGVPRGQDTPEGFACNFWACQAMYLYRDLVGLMNSEPKALGLLTELLVPAGGFGSIVFMRLDLRCQRRAVGFWENDSFVRLASYIEQESSALDGPTLFVVDGIGASVRVGNGLRLKKLAPGTAVYFAVRTRENELGGALFVRTLRGGREVIRTQLEAELVLDRMAAAAEEMRIKEAARARKSAAQVQG